MHTIFPSGLATSMVDPFDLIQDVSEPFSSSLNLATVAGSELGIHMIRLDAKLECSAAWPTMQPQAQPPAYLLARSQPEPSRPSQQHSQFPHQPANIPSTPLELAAHAPLVVNLTRDTHCMPYDYSIEMCAEIMRLGRVYKPAASVAKPSHPEPTLPPPAKQPIKPSTAKNPTQSSTSLPSASTRKDQPSADIIAQLKKVKADISIWDLIHTSSEH